MNDPTRPPDLELGWYRSPETRAMAERMRRQAAEARTKPLRRRRPKGVKRA